MHLVGYMLLDCDDPTAVHKLCSMLPAFVFEARPVIPIDDAVRVELFHLGRPVGANVAARLVNVRFTPKADKRLRRSERSNVPTRYDKLARNFLSAITLVAVLYWIKL
jgi:hypothetical protein